MREKIIVSNTNHLKLLIYEEVELYGQDCDLNHLDISQLDSLYYVFENSEFNGDISKWDTSHITRMEYVFVDSAFNGDISGWDVSDVTIMEGMFQGSQFNQDISNWNVENVANMIAMFEGASFNKDLTLWRPLNLYYTQEMFDNCPAPVPYWALSKDVKNAIENYEMAQKLDTDLGVKHLKTKIKI